MTALWSIVSFFLNLPDIFDILVVLFLILAFVRGALRGFWRAFWRFLFVIIVLDFSYLTLIEPFAHFINYGFWSMMGMTINVTLGGIVYHLSSFDDLIRQVVTYSSSMGYVPAGSKLLDPAYVAAFGMAFSKVIGWMVIILGTHFFSWVLSSLLYVFPVRLMVSPTAREHKYRPLGAIFGGLTGFIYVVCFSVILSPLHYGFAAMANSSQYPYIFSEYTMKTAEVLNPNTSILFGWIDYDGKPGGILRDVFSFQVTDDLSGETTTYYFDQEFVTFIADTTAPAE